VKGGLNEFACRKKLWKAGLTMRDLRKFAKKEKKEKIKEAERIALEDKDTRGNVEDIMNQYAGKSKEELLSDIMKSVKTGKQSGAIDEDKLKQLSQMAEMMDGEQKSRFNEVMHKLKDIT
jgi:hypothetical protein